MIVSIGRFPIDCVWWTAKEDMWGKRLMRRHVLLSHRSGFVTHPVRQIPIDALGPTLAYIEYKRQSPP